MSVEHLSLCRCRVLYLGSAIPLETAVGIEALQAPCRDRYDNVDSNQQASGIDSSLSVFSSGLMLQYAADESSTTWFPISSLHVCAAVKAVGSSGGGGGGGVRFVSLDTPTAMRSSNPPLFACIMRRTKGVKVLECHVFVCKSNQAAMALVQSCTHAFQHKEGWSTSTPPALSKSRLVSSSGFNSTSAGRSSKPRGGLDRGDLVQRFDVSCSIADPPKPAPAAPPQQQMMMVAMNPPGAPVPMVQPGMEYFADWNQCGGQPLMIIPESPFYPGAEVMKKQKRSKKKKVVKTKKTTKGGGSDSDEETTIFVKRSQLAGNRGGDSVRGRVTVQEIVQQQPPPQVVVPPPQPAPPPQIIIMPQPAAPQPAPQPAKSQQNPNTDVIVYAPQLIEKNQTSENFQYDGSDRHMVDYHPDGRRYQYRNDARSYDGRQDNRIDYNAQDFRSNSYRADQRQYRSAADNRRVDYRADNRASAEDNRRMDYYADNRRNRQDYSNYDARQDNRSYRADNRALQYSAPGPSYRANSEVDEEYFDGASGYGGDQDDFARGYYDAQVEAYNQQLAAYNQQQDGGEYCDDDDDGYYPEEYYPQPGYTDDYGVGDYQRFLPVAGYGGGPAVGGYGEVPAVAGYGGIPAVAGYGGVGYGQVADGLGYYP